MKSNRQIGVWLDLRNARIISPVDDHIEELNSDVDEFNPKGGYGSATPYEEQDVMSEQKFMRRRKQQMQQYFESILKEIDQADELVILGPAETRVHLGKFLAGEHRFKGQIIENRPLDSMSNNQLKAYVRDFFDPDKH